MKINQTQKYSPLTHEQYQSTMGELIQLTGATKMRAFFKTPQPTYAKVISCLTCKKCKIKSESQEKVIASISKIKTHIIQLATTPTEKEKFDNAMDVCQSVVAQVIYYLGQKNLQRPDDFSMDAILMEAIQYIPEDTLDEPSLSKSNTTTSTKKDHFKNLKQITNTVKERMQEIQQKVKETGSKVLDDFKRGLDNLQKQSK